MPRSIPSLAGGAATVLVSGEAGVGKSRFVAELRDAARAAGALWATGECVALGEGGLPYVPVAALIRDLTRQLDDATLRDVLGRGAGDLTAIVPGLADRLPGVTAASDVEWIRPAVFEAVVVLPRVARLPAARRPRARGPPLGRSRLAGPDRLPHPQPAARGHADRRHLPERRAPPTPSAAAVAGRDRAAGRRGADRPPATRPGRDRCSRSSDPRDAAGRCAHRTGRPANGRQSVLRGGAARRGRQRQGRGLTRAACRAPGAACHA